MKELDTRGMLCPLPIIELARAAAAGAPGAVIQVLADDPATLSDIPAWCDMKGAALLSSRTEHDDESGSPRYVFEVQI